VNVGKGVAATVKDPGATAAGLGQGVKRFGSNIGRKAKRTTDKAVDSTKSDDKASGGEQKSTSQQAEGVANSVLGVNGAARKWAQKVGVNPYTTNPVLKKALIDIGRVDSAGGLAAKIAVPIPPVVSATAKVGNLVWAKDPEALLKENEAKLKAIGASPDTIKKLYLARGFNLTLHTRLAEALSQVKAPGCADYVDTATEADTEAEAVFFTESAEALARFHTTQPVAAVLTDSRGLVAKTKSGQAVLLLPVDYVRWTAAIEKGATEIQQRAKAERGAAAGERQPTGRAAAPAQTERAARGWKVVENVASTATLMKAGAQPAPKK
jgi:hypothetical protein